MRLPKFKAYSLPEEATRILIPPGSADQHNLLPIYDLKRKEPEAPAAEAPAGAAPVKEDGK